MCGRMALSLPQDAMAQLFNARPANDLPPVPDFNICPTDNVHIVTRADDGPRSLSAMRWGLVPQWYKKPDDGPLLINARAETVADKPAFRDAVRLRRGLVIASGFYEWTKDADGGRDPWYFTRTDGHPLAFAAIWQEWADVDQSRLRSCAIVTTAAKGSMTDIHHRAPVVIDPSDWALWLGEKGKGAAPLMRAAADGVLGWHRVGRAVNSNRASGPALIAPLGDAHAE
ncbi:SOS response-associated peptidase [Sulfitobacter sp.]|uniref:SOS response-associated peptidase n=1 Tax=Sulfitobacter sp. TaxID=1903071 RepID=UPI003F6C45F6